ncbi:maleylpyruvate isomerase family mycothiol-dependent enzyme [Serinicoccus sediminis]|uniref:maleylpyruvate isomerase family mycothiol-dependent enzyme n=1 Tax=Serinicoccus sediminis TaxID=2306021 RepID=UPI00192D9242|nr:maleylpyruvate isomerase family mycothiol-dependent enzyme [Serinicoccus sediminis]
MPVSDPTTKDLWAAVHAERAALAARLDELTPEQWEAPSLCGRWGVREVVAHLTAAASVGRARWLLSVLGARLDFDLHNQRRLEEHLGATPQDTLAGFREVVTSTTAASGHTPAWLGEVVVHGQDILRPLGLPGATPPERAELVARFFVSRDFTVPSRTTAAGLRIRADDSDLDVGSGPEVAGATVALTMVLAGREAFLADVTGPGVAILAERIGT